MTYASAALGIGLLLAAAWIFRESRRPGSFIQPTDWLTGESGRLSGPKSFDFFAFWFTSWGFVVLFSAGSGSVELIGVYASIWTARSALNKFQNQQSNASITTTATTTTEVKPNVGG